MQAKGDNTEIDASQTMDDDEQWDDVDDEFNNFEEEESMNVEVDTTDSNDVNDVIETSHSNGTNHTIGANGNIASIDNIVETNKDIKDNKFTDESGAMNENRIEGESVQNNINGGSHKTNLHKLGISSLKQPSTSADAIVSEEPISLEKSLDLSLQTHLKPPHIVAHLSRLVIKQFYYTKPNYRLILELLLEGPRRPEQVKQMLLGDIESSEDLKMFKEEYLRDISINPDAMVSGDVIDSDMKSFALETIEDLTFNPYGSRLTDVEMSKSLGLPLKDVQSFLGRLVLDQLICVDTNWKPPKTIEQKDEERKESLRKSRRTKTVDPVLYYIDYVQFINVVLLRLAKLEKSIEELEQEREVEYACESCGQHYNLTQLAVLETQRCERCGGLVNETQLDQNLTSIPESVNRFHKNLRPLKVILAKCQEFIVSKNHTHKLKEFITKAEAEKRRLEGEKILIEESHDRKRRKRMEQTIRPVNTSFSSVFRTPNVPKVGVMPPNVQVPHFLNSAKVQNQYQQQQEQHKQKEESKLIEQENMKYKQQLEDDKRREQAMANTTENIVLVEDKEEEVDMNPIVKVAGNSKRFDEITEDDLDKMTSDEYDAYEAHMNRIQSIQTRNF